MNRVLMVLLAVQAVGFGVGCEDTQPDTSPSPQPGTQPGTQPRIRPDATVFVSAAFSLEAGMSYAEAKAHIEGSGARNWTYACSYTRTQSLAEEPCYARTDEYYDLPNGMLIDLVGISQEIVPREERGRDADVSQFVVEAVCVSNSRVLRVGKGETTYSFEHFQQWEGGRTHLKSSDQTKAFVYKGMLKEEAVAILRDRDASQLPLDSEELEKAIGILNEANGSNMSFHRSNALVSSGQWQRYSLGSSVELLIQFCKGGSGDDTLVAAMFCMYPAKRRAVAPAEAVPGDLRRGDIELDMLEYELINIANPQY